jgi:hypothetical protein
LFVTPSLQSQAQMGQKGNQQSTTLATSSKTRPLTASRMTEILSSHFCESITSQTRE